MNWWHLLDWSCLRLLLLLLLLLLLKMLLLLLAHELLLLEEILGLHCELRVHLLRRRHLRARHISILHHGCSLALLIQLPCFLE
jgi:hypothetical protein